MYEPIVVKMNGAMRAFHGGSRSYGVQDARNLNHHGKGKEAFNKLKRSGDAGAASLAQGGGRPPRTFYLNQLENLHDVVVPTRVEQCARCCNTSFLLSVVPRISGEYGAASVPDVGVCSTPRAAHLLNVRARFPKVWAERLRPFRTIATWKSDKGGFMSAPSHTPRTFASNDSTPLRLRDAAAIAFPMGGVTERTLRREHRRGRLTIYEIGGKHFTTLRDIAEMTRACSVAAGPIVAGAAAVEAKVEVDTARALASARAALAKL
jgi:hypothetical protein